MLFNSILSELIARSKLILELNYFVLDFQASRTTARCHGQGKY